MKGFSIAETLLNLALTFFVLTENEEERASLQSTLENKILELFSNDNQSYSQNVSKTLAILEKYVDHSVNRFGLSIHNPVNEFHFLFRILQTTPNIAERKIVFDILQNLLLKEKSTELYAKSLKLLEGYNYNNSTDYGVEDHSAICNLVVLTILAYKANDIKDDGSYALTHSKVLDVFFRLCSDFNNISNYKPANLDKIANFGSCIAKLGALYNLRELSEDNKCSDAFDDLVTKLMELADNKELKMEIRKECIENYLMK